MLEEKIMNNISNKNYEQASKELIEYKKQVKNNKVSLQFMTAMTAWIMREHNFSKEEISNTYKQSIRYTVPEFELSNVEREKDEILFDDKEILKLGADYRRLLGYMPQKQALYEDFTPLEYLTYIAELKEIKRKDAKKQI